MATLRERLALWFQHSQLVGIQAAMQKPQIHQSTASTRRMRIVKPRWSNLFNGAPVCHAPSPLEVLHSGLIHQTTQQAKHADPCQPGWEAPNCEFSALNCLEGVAVSCRTPCVQLA